MKRRRVKRKEEERGFIVFSFWVEGEGDLGILLV
jgi:hypothetical protein